MVSYNYDLAIANAILQFGHCNSGFFFLETGGSLCSHRCYGTCSVNQADFGCLAERHAPLRPASCNLKEIQHKEINLFRNHRSNFFHFYMTGTCHEVLKPCFIELERLDLNGAA